MFPIVPFLSVVGAAVSGTAWMWYQALDAQKKLLADKSAFDFIKAGVEKAAGLLMDSRRMTRIG